MPLSQGSTIELTPEKPVAGGRMLARHDGQVVFVAGAIPGERVRARVGRVSRTLAFADTIEVIDASPDRRTLHADWGCGGSHYLHITYARQLQLKSQLIADAFVRVGKMPVASAVEVMASKEHGYRMKARLHADGARFGFHREGTHQLCDAAPTRQLLPATIEALTTLSAAIHETGADIASYDVAENAAGTERAVYVELESRSGKSTALSPVPGVSGLALGTTHSLQEAIIYGSTYVTDHLEASGARIALTHHVRSFFQGNRFLLAPLLERVVAQVPAGAVFDLYAGVGLFAVALATLGRRVIAVEGDRFSARDLASNASPLEASLHVETTSVEKALADRQASSLDCVLLDPPRTGVSPEAITGLIALRSPRIVYVSCDAPTLARDAGRLVGAGYRLEHLEAFDLFPNTAHVETLAVFVK